MRIDDDVKAYVDQMEPKSLGQRVAMEVTLQEKRNQELDDRTDFSNPEEIESWLAR